MKFFSGAVITALFADATLAISIAEINGNRFLSPFNGTVVSNVTGLITAKGPSGIFLRSTKPDKNKSSSDSIYVYNTNFGKNLTVGDIITISGTVSEFRSKREYLYLTEIIAPKLTAVVSHNNTVKPYVIGKDTLDPPTEQYTSLDQGDVFGVPNNKTLLSVVNPELQPKKYGLDFWESLSGELVTIKKPTAIAKPNSFGDTWIVGEWKVTGKNSRGGLTMTDKDANPEAIIIGSPLDGTKNPKNTKLGDTLAEITGVVTYNFGNYSILPQTAVKVVASQSPSLPPPTTLLSTGDCKGITVGDYNIENLSPTSRHLPKIASHIVSYLQNPDILFVQEVQDNNGPNNDGVVDANTTLSTLVAAIKTAGGAEYSFVDVDPVDGKDGGQPGGNIRQAYLYNPKVLRLHKPNPGSSTDANVVVAGPALKFNPGRIDPANAAWVDSRKPLAAAWETLDGNNKFFTVNVHFQSKGGGSPLHGDARPPVNGGVENREAQAQVTADFIKAILKQDSHAQIVMAGDCNEFEFVKPLDTFQAVSKLRDIDSVTNVKPAERYTYLYDMNSQELDHMFISKSIKKAEFEHIHVNTWVEYSAQVSDHDPSVARLNLCQR